MSDSRFGFRLGVGGPGAPLPGFRVVECGRGGSMSVERIDHTHVVVTLRGGDGGSVVADDGTVIPGEPGAVRRYLAVCPDGAFELVFPSGAELVPID